MAPQVPLQGALVEARGRRGQVHCLRGIGAGPGCALSVARRAAVPRRAGRASARRVSSTRVKIDAMQVWLKIRSAISAAEKVRILFLIHGHEHIEGFAQEVAAAHAGVNHGKTREVERRQGIAPVGPDV